MIKIVLRILIVFLLVVLGGLVSMQLFSAKYIERYLIDNRGSELLPIQVTEVREITIKDNDAIIEGVTRVQRAVIGIESRTRSSVITGSGLIISSDGLVVTLAEIVPLGADFKFFINGDQVAYEIIKRDTQKNLALIKIDGRDLPTLEFADSNRIDLGERVFLVGTYFRDNNILKAVNEGIVSRINNETIKTSIREGKDLLGSSLFSVTGKVVGINYINASGEVYTIPISVIREFAGL